MKKTIAIMFFLVFVFFNSYAFSQQHSPNDYTIKWTFASDAEYLIDGFQIEYVANTLDKVNKLNKVLVAVAEPWEREAAVLSISPVEDLSIFLVTVIYKNGYKVTSTPYYFTRYQLAEPVSVSPLP